ncbi:DUF5677 domain-containing protein [Cellulosimicrobium cellulans]|uniref:DUF5677 domain-containing protein n=1 Tax=Cellulosimicrobium cellulans TaxID=1710 RepID=UPI0002E6D519|nr:DUF5677 domain-containing protein [Cellulosimicrobium cellulans]
MYEKVANPLTLPVEETAAVMREVLDAWHADRPASRLSRSAELPYGLVLFGHVAHVHRLAEGVLTLYDTGQALTALTLVRQMIETSIRAVWLSVYRENVYHLVRDGERQRVNAFKAAALTGQIPWDAPALVQSLDWLEENERVKGATSGESFKDLCDELDGGDLVYAQYRLASNYTHPGSLLLEEYVEIESAGSNERSITFVTKPVLSEAAAWLSLAAFTLILAGLTWDHADKTHIHRALLRRHALTYGVPTREFEMTPAGYVKWNAAQKARTRRR